MSTADDPMTAAQLEAAVRQARVAFARGHGDRAIALLDQAIARGGAEIAAVAIELRFDYARLLGRYREAIEGARVDGHPREAKLRARMADVAMTRGAPEVALRELERAILVEPRSASLRMARADAWAATEAWDLAVRETAQAVALARGDRRYLAAAARIALRVGAFHEAEQHALRADAHDVLAHLALFRGEADAALERAAAIATSGDEPFAATINGAALVLRGDPGAGSELDAALAADPGAFEARAWRGELRLRRGDFDGALEDADRAIAEAPGLLLCGRILRLLATIASDAHGPGSLGVAAHGEFSHAVMAMFADSARAFASGEPDAIAPWLDRALFEMRGNRTIAPSFVRDGVLVPLRFRPGPRFASRRVLDGVGASDPEPLLDALDALAREYPRSGLPRCHRGELLLWLGRWEEAGADLQRVVRDHPYTRWAYVGLAQVAMHEGRPDRALETLERGIAAMSNTTSISVHASRGEALRRLGRVDDAMPDLELACARSPTRVSAWINLALALSAAGRDAGPAAARVSALAWPLVHDAAHRIGVDPDATPNVDVLETALDAMQGCRASSLTTWRVGRSPVRCVRGGASAAALADARRRELARIPP